MQCSQFFFTLQVANGLALNETLLRQSKETIASFLKTPTLNALTVKEKLFVANECPTTVVELYLLVERCDERFSMEESAVLLAEIQNHLYLPENNPELSMAKTKARDPKSKGHGHSMYGGERQRGGRGGRGGGRSGGRGGHSGGRGGGGGGRGRGGRGGGNH
jgi:hypothetical protein